MKALSFELFTALSLVPGGASSLRSPSISLSESAVAASADFSPSILVFQTGDVRVVGCQMRLSRLFGAQLCAGRAYRRDPWSWIQGTQCDPLNPRRASFSQLHALPLQQLRQTSACLWEPNAVRIFAIASLTMLDSISLLLFWHCVVLKTASRAASSFFYERHTVKPDMFLSRPTTA